MKNNVATFAENVICVIRCLTLQIVLFGALCVLAPCVAHAALVFNTNVILNSGAEAGPGVPVNNSVGMVVPNWMTTAGNFSVVRYSSAPPPIPTVPRFTDPGPPLAERGGNFFAGGANGNPAGVFISSADQILDISNVASLIDSGMIPFTLSGYLGGYLDQRDRATISAIFNNNAAMTLGNSTIGPETLADRMGVTGLFSRSTSGGDFIPAGTRQIDFRIVITAQDGEQSDGYLDNLSFIARGPAATVPEPGSMGLLASGLAGLALWLRRKLRKVGEQAERQTGEPPFARSFMRRSTRAVPTLQIDRALDS